jgi:hypothetical protein
MKYPNRLSPSPFTLNRHLMMLFGIAGMVLVGVACSQKPQKHAVSAAPIFTPQLRTVALTGSTVVENAPFPGKETQAPEARKSAPQTLSYTSRDFGVSFRYPRQYAFLSARTIANDEDRMPVPDGGGRQIALVRIEIPKGYYPDTDFESGYFLLSLNPKLDEKQCRQWAGSSKTTSVGSVSVDGTEFHFNEVRSGGHGHASVVRQYSTFTNNTCYEVELGVTASNEDGLAREVDHEKVLGRLDAILQTVEILPTADAINPSAQEPVAAAVTAPQN